VPYGACIPQFSWYLMRRPSLGGHTCGLSWLHCTFMEIFLWSDLSWSGLRRSLDFYFVFLLFLDGTCERVLWVMCASLLANIF
jgi:hypothetical protein